MPTTAKDALSEAGISGDSTKNEALGSQVSSAAGAEIPVTVHASRYSSASKGTGKLPPVHEDTHTVIIFPQGAVVRLSATVTAGELVVLTNNRTGTDVICRVTGVKAQPGIQNYVHLEFTQRALDFWEEGSSPASGASVRKPSVVTTPITAPPVRIPASLGSKASDSPVKEAQPAPRTSASAEVEVRGSSTVPKITPLADLPAVGLLDTHAKVAATPLQGSDITTAPLPVHSERPVVAPATPRFQPFETAIPQRSTKSRSIVLFAIAAAVAVAIGTVAGPELWKRYGDLIPGLRNAPTATESTPMAASSERKASINRTSGDAKPVEPIAITPIEKAPADTSAMQSEPVQRVAEVSKAEAQPVVRPALNLGKISKPKMKRPAQSTSTEPPPVLSADAAATPNIISQSLSSATPQPNALPMPAPPAARKGGQLEQPKLLSSVAAVYPALARAQGVQGDVTIDALIDGNGKVSATNVLTGNPLLQKAAVDALRLWKYQPAKLNGEAIPIHINVTISFHLK